jgi:hypothetical protein
MALRASERQTAGKFLDHYHNDPYEWQDFHKCVHYLLAGMAAESSVSTVTQACIPTVFTIPPTFSTLLPATAIVKTEDMVYILQDSLWRIIYQNVHRGAPTAYAPSQQYAASHSQYSAPLPQQYSAPPPQSYTASAVPSSLVQSKNAILTDVLG